MKNIKFNVNNLSFQTVDSTRYISKLQFIKCQKYSIHKQNSFVRGFATNRKGENAICSHWISHIRDIGKNDSWKFLEIQIEINPNPKVYNLRAEDTLLYRTIYMWVTANKAQQRGQEVPGGEGCINDETQTREDLEKLPFWLKAHKIGDFTQWVWGISNATNWWTYYWNLIHFLRHSIQLSISVRGNVSPFQFAKEKKTENLIILTLEEQTRLNKVVNDFFYSQIQEILAWIRAIDIKDPTLNDFNYGDLCAQIWDMTFTYARQEDECLNIEDVNKEFRSFCDEKFKFPVEHSYYQKFGGLISNTYLKGCFIKSRIIFQQVYVDDVGSHSYKTISDFRIAEVRNNKIILKPYLIPSEDSASCKNWENESINFTTGRQSFYWTVLQATRAKILNWICHSVPSTDKTLLIKIERRFFTEISNTILYGANEIYDSLPEEIKDKLQNLSKKWPEAQGLSGPILMIDSNLWSESVNECLLKTAQHFEQLAMGLIYSIVFRKNYRTKTRQQVAQKDRTLVNIFRNKYEFPLIKFPDIQDIVIVDKDNSAVVTTLRDLILETTKLAEQVFNWAILIEKNINLNYRRSVLSLQELNKVTINEEQEKESPIIDPEEAKALVISLKQEKDNIDLRVQIRKYKRFFTSYQNMCRLSSAEYKEIRRLRYFFFIIDEKDKILHLQRIRDNKSKKFDVNSQVNQKSIIQEKYKNYSDIQKKLEYISENMDEEFGAELDEVRDYVTDIRQILAGERLPIEKLRAIDIQQRLAGELRAIEKAKILDKKKPKNKKT